MVNIGIGIIILTYCLLVHSAIKIPNVGADKEKLRNKLFTLFILLICEMVIVSLYIL